MPYGKTLEMREFSRQHPLYPKTPYAVSRRTKNRILRGKARVRERKLSQREARRLAAIETKGTN